MSTSRGEAGWCRTAAHHAVRQHVQTWRWLCERAKDAPVLRRKPDDAEPKLLSDALLLWLLAR